MFTKSEGAHRLFLCPGQKRIAPVLIFLLIALASANYSYSQELSQDMEDFLELFERYYLEPANTSATDLARKSPDALIVAYAHCLGRQSFLPSNSPQDHQKFRNLVLEAKTFLVKELYALGRTSVDTGKMEQLMYASMTGRYNDYVSRNFGQHTATVPSLFLKGGFPPVGKAEIISPGKAPVFQPEQHTNVSDPSIEGYWMSNFLTIRIIKEGFKFTGRITWAANENEMLREFGWRVGQTAFQVVLSEQNNQTLTFIGVSPRTDYQGKFSMNNEYSFRVRHQQNRRYITIRGFRNFLNLFLN